MVRSLRNQRLSMMVVKNFDNRNAIEKNGEILDYCY